MPNTICDLHLHTYYSDGCASPGEILHHAANIGLKTVAITDHDNVNALPEAGYVASELGLELIPGVEFTSRWEECAQAGSDKDSVGEIDILGYYIDVQDPQFLAFTRKTLADSHSRIEACCAGLSASGFPIKLLDVFDENPRYAGAMQCISALRRLGYASDWQMALSLFEAEWRQVQPSASSVGEVIEEIHRTGGIAVLAHPVSIRCNDTLLQAEQLAELVSLGLDGLEVYHPRLDLEARRHFRELAKRFNLIETGGSDEHGGLEGFTRMGSEPVPYTVISALKKRRKLRG